MRSWRVKLRRVVMASWGREGMGDIFGVRIEVPGSCWV